MKTFKQVTEQGNNLLLVDGLNMSFSFRGKSDYTDQYISMLDSLKRSYKCSKVLICVDKGSSEYRKGIYPLYKHNRVEKRETQTEQEAEDFAKFFKCFEDTLLTIESERDYPIVRFKGVEADDTIAYISSKVKKLPIEHIWIVSSDRDLNLLIEEGVSQFSYVTRKEFTVENWHDHYDFTRDEYISIKCLMGDSGDNIPGVDKIGPKKAHELIKTYGSTYDIIANLPIASKYVYIKNLNEFGAENLLLNYQLMDLVTHCEEAIGKENCIKLDRILEDYLT